MNIDELPAKVRAALVDTRHTWEVAADGALLRWDPDGEHRVWSDFLGTLTDVVRGAGQPHRTYLGPMDRANRRQRRHVWSITVWSTGRVAVAVDPGSGADDILDLALKLQQAVLDVR